MDVKRYKYVKYDTGGGYIREGLEPHPDGEWVKASDHAAALAACREECAKAVLAFPNMPYGRENALLIQIADHIRTPSPSLTRVDVREGLEKVRKEVDSWPDYMKNPPQRGE